MRTQEASEVAKLLFNEVFSRFGAPHTLPTDRGLLGAKRVLNREREKEKNHFYSTYLRHFAGREH